MSRSLPLAANRSSEPATVESALKEAVRSLIPHSGSAQLDAEVLLSHVLAVDRAALIARGSNLLAEEDLEVYRELLERRRAGAPVAYLTGRREFWSLPLQVTPAVLVPRPETERLVEIALEHLPQSEERAVLDLGTGSGAVALAIASERPRARVVAVDVSPGAVQLARDNARTLALPNVTIRLGSWFDPVAGRGASTSWSPTRPTSRTAIPRSRHSRPSRSLRSSRDPRDSMRSRPSSPRHPGT